MRLAGVAPGYRPSLPLHALPGRLRDTARQRLEPLRPAARSVLVYTVGFFPLWAPLLAMIAVLWYGVVSASP